VNQIVTCTDYPFPRTKTAVDHILNTPRLSDADRAAIASASGAGSPLLTTRPLRQAFGGGTALSRAHRLVRRMSEDIGLRIVNDKPPGRGALRRLRDAITQALLGAGFTFDPNDPANRKSGNESRYTIYRLPTNPAATVEGPCARPSRSRRPLDRCAAQRPHGR
jgi:Nucleotidyl transferase AbiEii toxin, Type IV TA system